MNIEIMPLWDFPEFIMIQELTFQTRLPAGFEAALEKITTALKIQGFGILTRIDVQDTFKQKLGLKQVIVSLKP